MDREPEAEAMDVAEEADAYAQADFAEVNEAFVNRLMYFVGARTGVLALDLGTGPGDIPLRAARYGLGWHIVAADISQPMLRHASRVIGTAGLRWAIHLVLMDAKASPFTHTSFDIIFSNSILHHVSDAGLFWREVQRVAKPGAFVLLRDLIRPESPEAAGEIVKRYAQNESLLLQEEYFRSLMAAYTPEEVREQLDDAGLRSLRVETVSDRHWDAFGWTPAR